MIPFKQGIDENVTKINKHFIRYFYSESSELAKNY